MALECRRDHFHAADVFFVQLIGRDADHAISPFAVIRQGQDEPFTKTLMAFMLKDQTALQNDRRLGHDV